MTLARARLRFLAALVPCLLAGVLSRASHPVSTVAYWRFEEGRADTVAPGAILDSSSSTDHGTSSGTPVYRSDVPVTTIPQTGAPNAVSLHFDSSDDEVSFASAFVFNQPGDATLEFWIRHPGNRHQAVLWGRPDDSDTNRFHVYVNPDRTLGADYRDPSGNLHAIIGGGGPGGGIPFTPDAWTHFAITRERDTYYGYRDVSG